MKKTRKKTKRKIDKYAMGSGNTGVIKGYMPDPSEVFRQNQIDIDTAQYEAASNPFVMGLDILGGLTTQVGMSVMSGASGGKGEAIADNAIDVDKSFTKDVISDFMKKGADGMTDETGFAAKGTNSKGVKGSVEAEGGEIVETPDGEMAELEGAPHAQGGIDINVPKGTLIFSDQLEVDGKSMADRKKAREKTMAKATKALEKDPNDGVAKETFKRVQEKNDYEEQSDLKVQGYAKHLDDLYNASMGTDPSGTYENGTDEEGVGDKVGDFFGGFSGGDYLSLIGNLYSGIAPLMGAKRNAAGDTPNVNQFEGFGDDALATVEEAGSMIQGQEAKAKVDVNLARNKSITRNRNTARGVNQVRALDLASDVNANKAMTDVYSSFSKLMMENLYKKAGFENLQDEVVMKGAATADIANRMDKDNADTQIGVAQESLGRGIQQTGKDLNANKLSRMLTKLTESLSKHGIQVDSQGNIIEG